MVTGVPSISIDGGGGVWRVCRSAAERGWVPKRAMAYEGRRAGAGYRGCQNKFPTDTGKGKEGALST